MHDAKVTSLSKIEVGQLILVTPEEEQSGIGHVAGRERTGKFRGFGRPKDSTAVPLRVTAKDFVPDTWSGKVWTLTLADGTKTEGRYGTTHVYVTTSKQYTAEEVAQRISDDPRIPGKARAVTIKGPETELELDLAVSGTKRVVVEKDGTMRVKAWEGGDVTERTPKGRLVHITPEGVLTILEDFPEEDEETAAADAVVLGSERCPQCKGFEVVRKRGSSAGKAYRTLGGSQAATANGNSEPCPKCAGTGLVARAA
jgi:hypothetical protein